MLACEDIVVVCSPMHPLADGPATNMRGLLDETFVDLKPDWGMRRLLDRGFAALSATRTTAFEVNDVSTLLDLVAQGLGIAMVPESIARARTRDVRASPIAVLKLSDNWLRVSIRLGAARLAERLGWEEMAAAKRAMR